MSSWKNSFIRELQEMSARLKMPDYRAFIFWYIKHTSHDLHDTQIIDLITDRSKDAGCDAVIIDNDLNSIRIIQSKFTKNIGEKQFNKDELVKLNKVYDYLTGESDYHELRSYINNKLKEKLDRAIRYIKDNNYDVRLYFITTHRKNNNYKLYENNNHPIEVLSVKEIGLQYDAWEHGSSPELGYVEMPYHSIVAGPPSERIAYIANFTTETLRDAYKKWGDKLFSRNVRIFQGSNKKPNKAMKRTLAEQAQYFWYFNNGITILSEKVKLQKTEQKLVLKNPQIINGCQTITSIGENRPTDAFLFAKIVQIGDDIENQNIIDGIIEANNRQVPVDERMLKSNHPLQVKLQRDLEILGYYYECKEGKYNTDRSKSANISNLEYIKNIDLVKCNIALSKMPQTAHDHEDDLFSTHFGEVFVERKTALDYLNPYLVWKHINRIGRNYRGDNRKRFHKLASFHVLRIIYDYCIDLRNNTKMNNIVKKLESNTFELDEQPIKRLFDIAYNKYGKSRYREIDSGQRDYIKSGESYKSISKTVPKYLERSIQYLFRE